MTMAISTACISPSGYRIQVLKTFVKLSPKLSTANTMQWLPSGLSRMFSDKIFTAGVVRARQKNSGIVGLGRVFLTPPWRQQRRKLLKNLRDNPLSYSAPFFQRRLCIKLRQGCAADAPRQFLHHIDHTGQIRQSQDEPVHAAVLLPDAAPG